MKNKRRIAFYACRVTAGSLGLLIVMLCLLLYIGEGGPPLLRVHVETLMTWLLILWCISVVLSLKWMWLGGMLGLVGVGGFYMLDYAASGRFPGGFVFPLLWIPPILTLASGFLGIDARTAARTEKETKQ